MAKNLRPRPPLVNGATTPTFAEEEELYTQLLRLRDAVVAGQHARFILPQSAIEQLKASSSELAAAGDGREQQEPHGFPNGSTAKFDFTTNAMKPHLTPQKVGLPGLQLSSTESPDPGHRGMTAKPVSSGGLDPIFLEKSDHLVRAEGQLKRQRIERELQAQVEQRKHSLRDRDSAADGQSLIDVEAMLARSGARENHISGLKPATSRESASSSFDENDYYSSQVQSDWSSESNTSKHSDQAAGAFTADFERLEEPTRPSFSVGNNVSARLPATSRDTLPRPSKYQNHVYTPELEEARGVVEEDDEYTPPDATAFDSFLEEGHDTYGGVATLDDDNSEYEPGEITQESNVPSPYQPDQRSHTSPRVPVIRNHLTHIAAPQPNRVSPLAVAKGPSVELELVNGRPEIVPKARPNQMTVQSRASTASPAGTGAGGGGKKKRNKKRKRDNEPFGRTKRQRERQAAAQPSQDQAHAEHFIKDEPVSPPPLTNVPEARPYRRGSLQHQFVDVDLDSPRPPPQMQHVNESSRSALRYEYVPPDDPARVRVAPPSAYQTSHRDTQDLRRVASHHHTQRPVSPTLRPYSPLPAYHAVSMTYGEPQRVPVPEPEATRYQGQLQPDAVRYVRNERSRSPPKLQEYRNPYGAPVENLARVPVPTAATSRIVVDQYGNRYYAAEDTAPSFRASVAPSDRQTHDRLGYERAPSRISTVYAHSPHASLQFETPESRMAPPPPPPQRRQVTEEYSRNYVGSNGYLDRDYGTRNIEPIRRVAASTSPVYQPMSLHDHMPPPRAPSAREPTSPIYAPQNYGVRTDDRTERPPVYAHRQASVAPVQYIRREAPLPLPRARSVMPAYEAEMSSQARAYSYMPQQVRYVDQNGQEVYPRQVRQVSEFRYQ